MKTQTHFVNDAERIQYQKKETQKKLIALGLVDRKLVPQIADAIGDDEIFGVITTAMLAAASDGYELSRQTFQSILKDQIDQGEMTPSRAAALTANFDSCYALSALVNRLGGPKEADLPGLVMDLERVAKQRVKSDAAEKILHGDYEQGIKELREVGADDKADLFETKLVEGGKMPPQLIVTDWETVTGDVEWLWPNRIPLEGITLIAGVGGKGKSSMTLDLAAIVSTGGILPSGDAAPMGDVLLISAEDPDKVIKKRLEQQGADLSRIHRIGGLKVGKDEKYFDLRDVNTLPAALKRWPQTKLLIIDPVASYATKVDSHKTADVRTVCAPMARFAEQHKIAVVFIIHLNKDENKSPENRIAGAGGWRDLARSVWFVVPSKTEEGVRYFLPNKNNYAPLGNGYIFQLGENGKLEWKGETSMNLDELMLPTVVPTKTDVSVEWLKQRLKSPALQTDVEADAAKMGIREWTLKESKKKLGVEAKRKTFGGPWWWSLEQTENNTSEDEKLF